MNVELHETLRELQTLYRVETNAKLARRIQGVYLAYKALTCPQIMDITGAKRRTVQQWIRKYNTAGIEALRDAPRPGQPTKLPRDLEDAFCRRLEAGPTDADGVSVLNGPAIRRILEREFGVVYSLRGVLDLLHRLDYHCLCPRPQHEQAAPSRQEEFKKSFRTYWTRSKKSTPERKSKSGSRTKPVSDSRPR